MLNEEVVLLDSDEEGTKAIETDIVLPITDMTDKEGSLDKDNETGVDDSEEVVVEYNHNDYADLVGPLATNIDDSSNGKHLNKLTGFALEILDKKNMWGQN